MRKKKDNKIKEYLGIRNLTMVDLPPLLVCAGKLIMDQRIRTKYLNWEDKRTERFIHYNFQGIYIDIIDQELWAYIEFKNHTPHILYREKLDSMEDFERHLREACYKTILHIEEYLEKEDFKTLIPKHRQNKEE